MIVVEIKSRKGAVAEMSFINPYTFVDFPGGQEGTCDRTTPCGHMSLHSGRLGGQLKITWEALSPVATPDDAVFPGSSIKGAVRSIHEALAGGCLRVLDQRLLPTYRTKPTKNAARDLHENWTLAWVQSVNDNGWPDSAVICSKVVWVRRKAFGREQNLETGSRVSFNDRAVNPGAANRPELDRGQTGRLDPGGAFVALIGDVGARKPGIHEYFLACGELPVDSAPLPLHIPNRVWADYMRSVNDTDDVRRRKGGTNDHEIQRPSPVGGGDRPMVAVEYPENEFVGYRRSVTTEFFPGDVVWVKGGPTANGRWQIDYLKVAAVWRHNGSAPLKERVPKELLPCSDPTSLCPSCQIFGSTEDDEGAVDPAATSRAKQTSYRAHVRVGPALPLGNVVRSTERLAPLGTPRPGAGQMYLNAGPKQRLAADRAHRPAREWGAEVESANGPRRVRGRKFYWAATAGGRSSRRHLATEADATQMVSEVTLCPTGTRWTSVIHFENLSIEQLGGLAAAICPRLVFQRPERTNGEYSLRLGKGKPLGLGVVRTTVALTDVFDAGSRYGDGEAPTVDLALAAEEFRNATSAATRQTWPDLAAVLNTAHVDGNKVRYPPNFDDGWDFWERSSGATIKGEDCPMPDHKLPRSVRQDYPTR